MAYQHGLEVSRRTFLIGASSLVAVAAMPSAATFIGKTAIGVIPSPLKKRKICDIIFSSMNEQPFDSTISWTFLRDEVEFFATTMNQRANQRWVCLPGAEIVFTEGQIFQMVVEPCNELTSLTMTSNVEFDPMQRPRFFQEAFRWRNGKQELESITACDPQDAYLLRAA